MNPASAQGTAHSSSPQTSSFPPRGDLSAAPILQSKSELLWTVDCRCKPFDARQHRFRPEDATPRLAGTPKAVEASPSELYALVDTYLHSGTPPVIDQLFDGPSRNNTPTKIIAINYGREFFVLRVAREEKEAIITIARSKDINFSVATDYYGRCKLNQYQSELTENGVPIFKIIGAEVAAPLDLHIADIGIGFSMTISKALVGYNVYSALKGASCGSIDYNGRGLDLAPPNHSGPLLAVSNVFKDGQYRPFASGLLERLAAHQLALSLSGHLICSTLAWSDYIYNVVTQTLYLTRYRTPTSLEGFDRSETGWLPHTIQDRYADRTEALVNQVWRLLYDVNSDSGRPTSFGFVYGVRQISNALKVVFDHSNITSEEKHQIVARIQCIKPNPNIDLGDAEIDSLVIRDRLTFLQTQVAKLVC